MQVYYNYITDRPPVQNCCICDIGDKELVQRQDVGAVADVIGDMHQGVGVALVIPQLGMHIEHEVMEVYAFDLHAAGGRG